jgi:hypothetical protein
MERKFKQKQGLARAKEEEDKKQRLRRQGLTLADFKAQLEDLLEHIAPVRAQLEHLRATSTGCVGLFGGYSQLKLSGKGKSMLKLSGNGNECKPLCGGRASTRSGC